MKTNETSAGTIPIVRVIVEDGQGRFLFLKRGKDEIAEGTWCLPGGRIEQGEDPKDTVRREIKEETDLETTDITFLYNQIEEPYDRKVHAYNFSAKARGTITLNSESTDFAWISPGDFKKYPLPNLNEKVVLKYLRERKEKNKRKSRRD